MRELIKGILSLFDNQKRGKSCPCCGSASYFPVKMFDEIRGEHRVVCGDCARQISEAKLKSVTRNNYLRDIDAEIERLDNEREIERKEWLSQVKQAKEDYERFRTSRLF